MRTYVRMGSGPEKCWKRFRLAMEKGQFDLALNIARANELIIELGDALDLTLMAAKERKPIFDPMAVRIIWLLHDKGALALAEHEWLAHHFQAVEKGDDGAVKKIESFLATGKRLK
jgi:hypothetical protein